MSPVWIAFACGCLLGSLAGVFVVSLCLAAKRGDEDRERMFAGVVPPVEFSAEYPERYTLKLFCLNDHEWHGECLPACCPACHSPAVGART